MNNSREVTNNGTNTSHKWHWYYNRILLNCLVLAFSCFIGDLTLRTWCSENNVLGTLCSLLDNVLITIIAACTIGILWEISGKNELIQEIQHQTDKSLREAGLSTTLSDQGILHTTVDFIHDISWNDYIADADEIDVCWWAGSGWIRENIDAIKTAIQTRHVRMRYAIPDPHDENTLFLMGSLSGITDRELVCEYDKVPQELRPLGEAVELYNLKTIPLYGMVRLGHRIIFFPYSHLKDRPKNRPTFVIDANSELGRRLLRDFEELLRANEESSS